MIHPKIFKLITVFLLPFFLFVELFLSLEAMGLAIVHAQENIRGNQSQQNASDPVEDDQDMLTEMDNNQEDGGISELLLIKNGIDNTFGPVLDRPPSLVLDPYDQIIIDLYVDPEKVLQNRAEPGSDRKIFEQIVQEQLGVAPPFTNFQSTAKLEEKLADKFSNQQSIDRFIDRLQDSLGRGFVAEANVATLQRIIEIAKGLRPSLPATAQTELDAAVKEKINQAARDIGKLLTGISLNEESFTPIIVSLFRAIEPLPLDRRIVNTLLYLVTDRDQGGGGHERIKVQRIWKDYADDKNAKDRERKDADNESPHRRGQAIDISEIDNVKCTLYKSGWFKRKGTPRPPIPIKVSFQSEDTLARTAEGSSELPLGFSSMFDVFKEMGFDNILSGFSELDLENLDEESLKDASFSDLLNAIGEQLMMDAIGMVGKGSLNGYNFTNTIQQVGQAFLADKIGVPRYALAGDKLEDIEANIGRADLEERLDLPPRSLQGVTLQDITYSVGARKIEKSLRLRTGTLNTLSGSFTEQVGQGYIEEIMRLKPGSFASGNLDDIRRNLGEFRFKSAFEQNPTYVDDQLKTPAGTTAIFLQNRDPASFKATVGKRVLEDAFKLFPNFKENMLSYIDTVQSAIAPLKEQLLPPVGIRTRTDTIAELDAMGQTINQLIFVQTTSRPTGSNRQPNPGPRRHDITPNELHEKSLELKTALADLRKNHAQKISAASNPNLTRDIINNMERAINILVDTDPGSLAANLTRNASRRDDVLGTPQGSLDRLIAGDSASLRLIGAQELANHLSLATTERQLINRWFSDPNTEIGPVIPAISLSTGLKKDDFLRVFTAGSSDVFRSLGERRLLKGLVQMPEFRRFEQEFFRDHPELAEVYTNINFRLDRLREIKRDTTRLDRLAGNLDSTRKIRESIDVALRNPAQLDTAIANIGHQWDSLDRTQQIQTRQEAQTIMENMRRNFRALVDGQYPRSYASISASDIGRNQKATGELEIKVSPFDILDMISKRKTPTQVVQTIGFRAVEGAVGLPPESLFYFSQSQEKSPENFFAAIGQSRVDYVYGKGNLNSLIDRNRARADRDLNLKRGTTEAFLGAGPSADTVSANQDKIDAYNSGYRDGQFDKNGNIEKGDELSAYSQSSAQTPFTGPFYESGYTAGRSGQPANPPAAGQDLQTPNQQLAIKLSSQQYLEQIGRQTLIFSSVRRFTQGLQIDGLTFTPDDIYMLLTGGGQEVFARAAGYKIDQTLSLFPGSMYKVLSARNDQERTDAIAIAGGAFLGNKIGIGPIDLRAGDPIFSTGATILENSLGFKQGSVRKSNNLQELEKIDSKAFDKLFDNPERTDRVLGIDRGTTQKLHDGQVSLNQYASLIGRRNLQDRFVDSDFATGLLASVFGIDQDQDFEAYAKLRLVSGNLYTALIRNDTINKSFDDWATNDRRLVFQAFETAFGLHFDHLASVTPGTFAEIFSNPTQARQIALREGIRSLDDQLGLDNKLELAYNFYTLRSEQTEIVAQNREVVIDRSKTNTYQLGYAAAQKLAAEHPRVFSRSDFAENGELIEVFDESDYNSSRNGYYFNDLYPPDTTEQFYYEQGFRDFEAGNKPQQFRDEANSGNGPAQDIEGFFRTNRQKVIETAESETAVRIQQIIFDNLRVSVSTTDIINIAHGDVRTFQYIGLAEMVKRFREFAGTGDVPAEYQINYSDIKTALEGSLGDQSLITQTGNEAQASALSDIIDGKISREKLAEITGFAVTNDADLEIASAEYVRLKREQAQQAKASEIKNNHQQHVQYKLLDIVAYRVDNNTPVGFSEALFRGNVDTRNKAMLGYFENRANRNDWLGFDLPRGTTQALYDYFAGDRSDVAFQNLAKTGVFGTLEQVINQKELLGFQLPDGVLYASFRYAQTGNAQELNPFNNQTIGQSLGAILARPIFSWADKTFKMPLGSSFQIAKMGFDISQAVDKIQALSKADILGESNELLQAKQKLGNLKGQLAAFVITTVFQKQLLQADKSLGLVPGSMGILIGYSIPFAFPGTAFNPVTLGITLGIFLLMNIFGFNKTQFICTGDGYYPRLTSLTPNLHLGLPEFNGMNPGEYRQGLLQASRARVRGLIEDLMEMPYHINSEGQIILEGDFNDAAKPIQLITRRREDFEHFYENQIKLYSAVFNEDEPGPTNRQGILTGSDYLVDDHVHIGF